MRSRQPCIRASTPALLPRPRRRAAPRVGRRADCAAAMNLRDDEWEPAATDGALLRGVKAAVKGAVSAHDVGVLRATLLAPPLRGAVPHEARGAVWLVLLGLRPEDLLAEDAGDFARAAREAVGDGNAAEQIEADVARTRPALARFKQPAVRGALLRLLSLFCVRKGVGYTQGLNELLAPFVLLADTGGNPRIVFALFSAFLERFAPWMLDSSESKVFDVLKRAFKYFGRLLLYHDPVLFWRLEREGMTPDLYATSWFVTLFARNFTVETVLALWDLLLLEDNPLGTCFFGLALLLERREDLMRIDSSRLPETLMMLGVQSPAEVHSLWTAAGVLRAGHTPPSFQRLMSDRLLYVPGDTAAAAKGIDAARFMQASVCLQTTPDDLTAGEAHYFSWDCRTRAEYDSGHLAQAAHLPLDALRAVAGEWAGDAAAEAQLEAALRLCEPLRTSSHICLVGSGVRDEDDADVNVLALFLTERGVPYVSTLRGGFRAALAAASDEESLFTVDLVDYNAEAHEEAIAARRAERDAAARRRALAAAGAAALASAQEGEVALRRSISSAASAASSLFSQATAGVGVPHGGAGDAGGGIGGGGQPRAVMGEGDAAYGGVGAVLSGLGMRLTAGVSVLGGGEGEMASPGDVDGYGGNAGSNPFSPNSTESQSPKVLEEYGSMVTVESGGDGAPSPRTSAGMGAGPFGYGIPSSELPTIKRSLSNVAGAGGGGGSSASGDNGGVGSSSRHSGARASGAVSVENSPRMMDVPSSTISPRPGVADAAAHDNGVDAESPIRKKGPARGVVGGFFGATKSPWGRDARPGWLSDESLALPLAAMPKGYTVNVMDDRVMAGLRLFPCRARSDRAVTRAGKSGEFKRRYVGVCANYFMLLSPHSNRGHLLEVKLIRLLQDIVRITFKRSRPELVTFEILGAAEGEIPNEHIVCIMPDGLSECVELIKDYLGQKEDGAGAAPSTALPVPPNVGSGMSGASATPADSSSGGLKTGTSDDAASGATVSSPKTSAEVAATSAPPPDDSAAEKALVVGGGVDANSDKEARVLPRVVDEKKIGPDGGNSGETGLLSSNCNGSAPGEEISEPALVARPVVSEVGSSDGKGTKQGRLREERRMKEDDIFDGAAADDVLLAVPLPIGELEGQMTSEVRDVRARNVEEELAVTNFRPEISSKVSGALSEEARVDDDLLEDEDEETLSSRPSELFA